MNSYCERIQQVIHRAASGMTREQLEWRPAGKWSAAEIIEHLVLSYTGTTAGSRRCLESGKPLARISSISDRLRAFVVVNIGYLPSGRQAPETTKPKGLPGSEAIDTFNKELAAMDDAMSSCAQKFGSREKLMNHPIIGPLTVDEWRKFHLVHARHHAKQIQKLRRSLQGKD